MKELRCMGRLMSLMQTTRPWASIITEEQSCRSLILVEYADFMRPTRISSAMEARLLPIISTVIGLSLD